MVEKHLAALQPRRSNIITPENSPPAHPLTSFNTTNVTCTPAQSVVGKGEGERKGEISGVMILLRRGRSAAKCSSAIHYSYHFFNRFENMEIWKNGGIFL